MPKFESFKCYTKLCGLDANSSVQCVTGKPAGQVAWKQHLFILAHIFHFAKEVAAGCHHDRKTKKEEGHDKPKETRRKEEDQEND